MFLHVIGDSPAKRLGTSLLVLLAKYVFKELDWNIINVFLAFVSWMCRTLIRSHKGSWFLDGGESEFSCDCWWFLTALLLFKMLHYHDFINQHYVYFIPKPLTLLISCNHTECLCGEGLKNQTKLSSDVIFCWLLKKGKLYLLGYFWKRKNKGECLNKEGKRK